MSAPARLEQGYRRLLAWYPVRFRSEQGEEMLAVLMAGAQPGQRRPGLMESVDVLRSALGMRLWSLSAGLRSWHTPSTAAVTTCSAAPRPPIWPCFSGRLCWSPWWPC